MQPVAIALGANLGEREAAFTRAALLLDAVPGVEVLALSSLYDSAPWGLAGQPEFLNACLVARASLDPGQLLAAMQAIEARFGPKPAERNGPRFLDLDLLLHGDERRSPPPLELPHPRASGRPFVIWPLREAMDCAAPMLRPPASWDAYAILDAAGHAIAAETARRGLVGLWPSAPLPREAQATTRSPEATEALGRALGEAARPGDVFALTGPLGAGKSCLARGIGRGLGVAGALPSPTFTLCREHPAPRAPFHHWDFYRMETHDDLESAAWDDSLAARAVLACEWADKFPDEFPPARTIWIDVARPADGDERALRLCFPPGALALRAAAAQALAP